MKIIILGAGLAGLSVAYFLQDNPKISEITILEKESNPGGLCRSFSYGNIHYDIGPHIIFSKNFETLKIIEKEILNDEVNMFRRSNMILLNNKLIQYPFENDLSKLGKIDARYCLETFINNPYKNNLSLNMLDFFYKTFGKGITDLYLKPYNDKIWKFPIDKIDTQMVERIPRPPDQDIIDSANGKTIDGYLHQLHFTYPKEGGIQKIIDNLILKLNNKVEIRCNHTVDILSKLLEYKIISTIPLKELVNANINTPQEVKDAANNLKHNSIYIAIVNVKEDYSGDHFAFMVPDKEVIFHRISKLDFIGESIPGSVTYLAEITVPQGNGHSIPKLRKEIILGLNKIGFIENESEVNFTHTQRFEYAYPIYDLDHKKNTMIIKDYFKKEGIELLGRFGTWEYQNMDKIIEEAKKLADRFRDL